MTWVLKADAKDGTPTSVNATGLVHRVLSVAGVFGVSPA
jgi:hypothetical protein